MPYFALRSWRLHACEERKGQERKRKVEEGRRKKYNYKPPFIYKRPFKVTASYMQLLFHTASIFSRPGIPSPHACTIARKAFAIQSRRDYARADVCARMRNCCGIACCRIQPSLAIVSADLASCREPSIATIHGLAQHNECHHCQGLQMMPFLIPSTVAAFDLLLAMC